MEVKSMAIIAPFKGVRYNNELVSDLSSVTAPPNDKISDELNLQLCSKNEYNIAKIGFSETTGDISNNRYKDGAAFFESWIEQNILIRDEKPAFYIYEQKFMMNNNLQSLKGIICLVKLEDYENRVVLPHQKTSKKGCVHRHNLINAIKANISPIYSLYNDDDVSISSLIVANSSRKPDISFESEEGITQNIWIADDEKFITEMQKKFENRQIFIADGHHRYETNLKYRDEMRKLYPQNTAAPYEYTMMALMPMYSSGLFVLPTHRLVKGVEYFDENLLITALTEDFKVSKIYFTENNYEEIIIERISDVIDEKYLGLYTGNDYYYLLKPGGQFTCSDAETGDSSPLKKLEASIFNSLILEKYLGLSQSQLEDPNFVTYTRSAKEAIKEVQSGNYQCAFFLNSTKVDELRQVAESGDMMPLKSTFFWPKPLTGLVIYKFN